MLNIITLTLLILFNLFFVVKIGKNIVSCKKNKKRIKERIEFLKNM